jgi:hypothetical protein
LTSWWAPSRSDSPASPWSWAAATSSWGRIGSSPLSQYCGTLHASP